MKKVERINEIKELLNAWKTEKDQVNSYLVRFHRCYLDGSYGDLSNTYDGGYKLYQLHMRKFSKKLTDNTWRNNAISSFKAFLLIEFFNRRGSSLSNNDVEIMLTEALGEQKELFVNMLIDNCKDLAA